MNAVAAGRALLAGLGFVAVCMALGQPQRAAAQSGMAGHAMGVRDQVPPETLPVPQKLSGIGNVSIRITASPEAQMWFNQGLNLLHDFWEYESARAFEQGIRVDPQCAMCYWGLYKAEGSFHSTAKDYANQALTKAAGLEGHVSNAERLYIRASVAHEDALKGAKQGRPDFSKELKLWRKLVTQYPKDTQARIFLSQSFVVDQKEYLAILQSILKDEPDNSAANHYWIHALEASPHPEEALHSAEILASLAPTSGHIVHMPGHIFYRVGDYARAEKAFAASMETDERYMQEQHVQPDDDWNYVHNLMYAIANLLEEGKLKDATALSMKLTGARGQLDSTLYTYASRDSISRLNPLLPVALRTADWQQVIELLQTSEPPSEQANLGFLERTLADFAGGMQAIEAQDLAKAEELSLRVDADLWQVSQQLKDSTGAQGNTATTVGEGAPKLQLMPDALLQPLINNLSVMSLELRAAILIAKKQTDEGKKLFGEAAQEEKALGYREPPNYIRPVGETEGAALMAAGDWKGAREAYKRALLERPRSGFPLYGIAICNERSGDTAAATAAYMEFLQAWKDADSKLPQLMHAQSYVAENERGL
jgi:tetratricopeptide (TPR) repeat protein